MPQAGMRHGRQKRAFQAEFTEVERIKARKIYNTFYRWYLKTGTPDRLVILLEKGRDPENWDDTYPTDMVPARVGRNVTTWRMDTFDLAKRLINFFGTI